ncbi:hypothetical protein [Micromonospora sp. NPDC003816]|uniref:hypothetical protein n=1 Tax=Micromonospora sp. NPDC003816 TaxID=3364224 RepID=UPI003697DC06
MIRERTDRNSFDGWTWIEVYVLDARGDATDRRELFVRPGGMRPAPPPAAPRRTPVRRNAPRAAR